MQTFYGTFGFGDLDLRYKFVKIEAESREQAQEMMFHRFGQKWSMLYDEEQFDGQVEQFGLSELL